MYERMIKNGIKNGKSERKKREQEYRKKRRQEKERENSEKAETKRKNDRFAHVFFLELESAIREQIASGGDSIVKIYLMTFEEYRYGRHERTNCCWLANYKINDKDSLMSDVIGKYYLNLQNVISTIKQRLKILDIKVEIKDCNIHKSLFIDDVHMSSMKVFILDIQNHL